MPETTSKTDQQIVDDCAALARKIFAAQGWEASPTTKFYDTQSTRAQGAWRLACLAYEHIEGTDPEDALSNVQSDQEEEAEARNQVRRAAEKP